MDILKLNTRKPLVIEFYGNKWISTVRELGGANAYGYGVRENSFITFCHIMNIFVNQQLTISLEFIIAGLLPAKTVRSPTLVLS